MGNNFKPLHNRLVVQRLEDSETTPGGIVIPDAAREAPSRGVVVAAGEEAKYVSEEDVVLFSKYAGNEVDLDGETYLIVSEDDVMLILK